MKELYIIGSGDIAKFIAYNFDLFTLENHHLKGFLDNDKSKIGTKFFGIDVYDIVFSGGGYFRFFPLLFIKKMIERNDYNIFYFHIGDLITEQHKFISKADYERYFKEEGTFINRAKRYFKSNIGTGEALNKLKKLLSLCKYENVSSANELIEWQKQNIIQL